jgi:hypothetical protein
MEAVETFGIVIGAQKNEKLGGSDSFDIFTMDHGIMRWFSRSQSLVGVNCVFEDVKISGSRTTETAGNLHGMEILSKNSDAMRQNGSYEHGKTFIETMRKMVFDGIPMCGLFAITRQAIKNFASNFNADVVLLKALYLLCKEEGYAVDATWINSLSPTDKIFARGVIFLEFDCITFGHASALIDSLRQWMLSL